MRNGTETHLFTSEYKFFSTLHGTLSKIEHILAHRRYFSKCQRIKIILCISPDHSAMDLEVNDKRNCYNSINTWKFFKNALLNKSGSRRKLKRNSTVSTSK